jgi:hypothetical protein
MSIPGEGGGVYQETIVSIGIKKRWIASNQDCQGYYTNLERVIEKWPAQAVQMNLKYKETTFVVQNLLQPQRQNLRNWNRLRRPIWLHKCIIDSFLLS